MRLFVLLVLCGLLGGVGRSDGAVRREVVLRANDGDNTLLIRRDSSDSNRIDVWLDSKRVLRQPISRISHLIVEGLAGDDHFIVDHGHGFVDLDLRLHGGFQRSALGDSLSVRGALDGARYEIGRSERDGKSGRMHYRQGLREQVIEFSGLEPIEDLSVSANLIINASENADLVNIVPGPLSTGLDPLTNAQAQTYQVNFAGAAELINFRNKATVTINALGGGDTITLDLVSRFGDSFATLQVNGGDAGDTIFVRRTPSGLASTMAGDAGDDTCLTGNLVDSMDGVQGSVIFNGGAGSQDALQFHDQGDAGPNTITVTNNSITRSGAASVAFVLAEVVGVDASAGNDTINVIASFSTVGLTVNGGFGDDTFQVGNAGSLDSHSGAVQLIGGAGSGDVLNFNDNNDPDGNDYALTALGLTRGSAPEQTYSGFETLVVNGGSGADNFYVQSTAATPPVTINAGDGNDTANIGLGNSLDSIFGTVVFVGQGGLADAVFLNDQTDASANTYTLTNNTLTRSGSAGISYVTIESLSLLAGLGNDTINFTSQFSTVDVSLDAGAGSDTVNLGNAGNLTSLSGLAELSGGVSGIDTLNFNDQNNANSAQYRISALDFDRDASAARLSYVSFENWLMRAGSGASTVVVEGLANPALAEVRGGNPTMAPGDSLQYFGPPAVFTPGAPGSGAIDLSPTQILSYIEMESVLVDPIFRNSFE